MRCENNTGTNPVPYRDKSSTLPGQIQYLTGTNPVPCRDIDLHYCPDNFIIIP